MRKYHSHTLLYLHETIALLFGHHLRGGYDRFVINHYWSSAEQIADLDARLRGVAPTVIVRCFRLTLPMEDNLDRIARRQTVRAIDEADSDNADKVAGVARAAAVFPTCARPTVPERR